MEKIYINGDGADWIRTGAGMHTKARFVLDRFHMHKYIISATSHLKDSAQDARSEIYKAINGKRKWAAEEAFDKILHVTESETKAKAVESAKNYILGNWTGIMESVKAKDKSLQCGAEGHVSHIYSGWQDCVYTARIRGIYWNWFDTRKKNCHWLQVQKK